MSSFDGLQSRNKKSPAEAGLERWSKSGCKAEQALWRTLALTPECTPTKA